MSASAQRGSSHRKPCHSTHHKRVIDLSPVHITPGKKCVYGVAWWPGYLPFTLDGTTVDGTKFQTDINTPNVTTKYCSYEYRAEVQVDFTFTGSGDPHSEYGYLKITFTFDSTFGDLVNATYDRVETYSPFQIGGQPNVDLHYSWSRTSGYYRDSAMFAATGITPDNVPWATGTFSVFQPFGTDPGVELDPFYNVPTNENSSPGTATVGWTDGGSFDGVFRDDETWSASVAINLGENLTQLTTADLAQTLAESVSLTNNDAPMSLLYASSYARWLDPSSYFATTLFTFAEYAQDLVTAGTAESATNRVCRVYNRYFAEAINLNLGVEIPEGLVVAYGQPNGINIPTLVDFAGMTDWWDEPVFKLGIVAARSRVDLPTGLFCGNTSGGYYYDTELLYPRESDGSTGGVQVGVGPVSAGVRVFAISELQGQLSGFSRSYGAGFIGNSIASPACP